MNKITLLFIALLIFGCSKNDGDDGDNCQDNKNAINAKYDAQIQTVKDNPEPTGINYRQIGLLNEERNLKLSEACK